MRSTAAFAMALVGTLVLALSLERPAAWWAGVAVLMTVPLAGLTGLAVLAVPFPRPPVIASLSAAGVLVAVGWPLRGLPTALLLAVCLTVYASTAAWFGAITREDLRALLHPRSALGAAE